MNLLSYSTKPILHLVIPIRIAVKRVVTEFESKTCIASAMKKMFLYELGKGKLLLKDNYQKLCMSVLSLLPEADRIVDDKVYNECIKEACSIFQTFVKNHGITLEIGNYNDLFHVLVWYV